MFEESSRYRSYCDILAHARDACPKAADTSYDEVDMNACAGRLIEFLYNGTVNQ